MSKKNYIYYTDPSHGWVKVSKAELVRLEIADKITICSYQRGDYAYLEEDYDVITFINAKSYIDGIDVDALKFNNQNTDKRSRIRKYNFYSI